ncbi:MAG TPA: hypothetical protein VN040_24035 [Pseudosphingobacterium sp.]|nr:hypothetical protein [Pseudosphingobacterium sp.]
MKDEQKRKLLREQRDHEGRNLDERDVEAYEALFDLLATEKSSIRQTTIKESIVDDTMAHIVFLEEQKDKRRDAISLSLGLLLGLVAVATAYFFIDRPLLFAMLDWAKQHLYTLLFSLLIILLIQLADRKLVRRIK